MFATGCSGRCSGAVAAMASISSPLYSTSTTRTQTPNFCSLPNPNFFHSSSSSSSNFDFNLTHNSSRSISHPFFSIRLLKICHTTRRQPKNWVRVSCKVNDSSEAYPESGPSSVSNDSTLGATIDIKLPRRSLLVSFTCNACGERSQRLINRLAYERGTVYVQCSGCSQYHKLVDNLNLVVEYDFREVIDLDEEQA